MNSVLPGDIDPQSASDSVCTRTPRKRAATANKTAQTVAFLLSDTANYTLGQHLCVDGGLGCAV